MFRLCRSEFRRNRIAGSLVDSVGDEIGDADVEYTDLLDIHFGVDDGAAVIRNLLTVEPSLDDIRLQDRNWPVCGVCCTTSGVIRSSDPHGFMPDRSPSQTSRILEDEARWAMPSRGVCLDIIPDIEAAFNNVRWPMISGALNERHLPLTLKTLNCSYLSDRQVSIPWQGSARTIRLSKR